METTEYTDLLKIIAANNQINLPNLQLDVIEISDIGFEESKTGKAFTKSEYKRILGIFIVQEIADNTAKLTLEIGRERVVGRDSFHTRLITVNSYLSVRKQAWMVDIPINNSPIDYTYEDNRESGADNNVFIYLICEKE